MDITHVFSDPHSAKDTMTGLNKSLIPAGRGSGTSPLMSIGPSDPGNIGSALNALHEAVPPKESAEQPEQPEPEEEPEQRPELEGFGGPGSSTTESPERMGGSQAVVQGAQFGQHMAGAVKLGEDVAEFL